MPSGCWSTEEAAPGGAASSDGPHLPGTGSSGTVAKPPPPSRSASRDAHSRRAEPMGRHGPFLFDGHPERFGNLAGSGGAPTMPAAAGGPRRPYESPGREHLRADLVIANARATSAPGVDYFP